jgi:multiple sugar transport system permease protein
MTQALSRSPGKRKLPGRNQLKEWTAAYVFLLPALALFATFVIYPMIRGVYLSFFRLSGRKWSWVGIRNYAELWNDPVFWKSLANTMLLVIGNVPIVIILSLFVAMAIYRKRPAARSLYRGIFYLPAVSSVVSITVVWSWIYHPRYGVLNYLTGLFGAQPVAWLGDPRFALLAILVVMITLNVGQPIILYVAALGNIPESYVEAAEIDGANHWQRFKGVIWPLLAPTTLYIVIITTINSFQVFAIIQLLTSGGPAYSTTTLMYQVYERAFQLSNFGQASALGVILALIIATISVVQFKFLKSDIEY